MDGIKLKLEGVCKSYANGAHGNQQAVDNVDLEIKSGEFVCIVGPSGCGKTTLINMILGIEKLTAGRILIDSVPINGVGRDRACVFQENTLFPWLSVRENVELGLKVKKRRVEGMSKQERRAFVEKYLDKVGLLPYADHRIHQLSGGMKQRVSIARALVLETEILIMDEPFGALDIATKHNMYPELLKIWRESGKTLIFITHDIEEAVLLAQRVVVMGNAPHSIKKEISISLPHPRSPEDTEIACAVAEIKSMISDAYANGDTEGDYE